MFCVLILNLLLHTGLQDTQPGEGTGTGALERNEREEEGGGSKPAPGPCFAPSGEGRGGGDKVTPEALRGKQFGEAAQARRFATLRGAALPGSPQPSGQRQRILLLLGHGDWGLQVVIPHLSRAQTWPGGSGPHPCPLLCSLPSFLSAGARGNTIHG